jgi:hypothetical protein
MAVLGYNPVGGGANTSDLHAFIYGQIFQVTENGTVTDINCYFSADVEMTMGIYNSSSTTPSSLIMATAGGTTGVSGAGYKTKSLSASLVANNYYALTVTYNTLAGVTVTYDVIASSPRYFQNPYTYSAGSLPGTFPMGTADSADKLAIYVNYTPSGAAGGSSLMLTGVGKDFSFPITLFGGLEALRKRKNKVRQWEKKGHIWRMAA